MTTLSPSPALDPRRLAWAVVMLALAAALCVSVEAARRGWQAPLPAPAVPVIVALPAAGTTGPIALPAAASAAPSPDPGISPAAPFRLGDVAAVDRARALECLTAAVYYEASAEPDAGQQAVAQVVLNRVRHPAFPATVCGVVYQGADHAGCQFSFACDGAVGRHPPAAAGWARAARVAAAALAGRVYAPVGLATHYHRYAVTPAWNRAMVMTDAVGAHFFHRWKGWWGTPAAFRQRYAGGEPAGPSPPAPAEPTSPTLTPRPSVIAVQPPAGAAAADDRLPAAPTILPRWAETGRPLR